ncbi:MAG TPA: hypothetical protein VFX65_14535 [Candidatus Limnocylindrales bacterium]|nr:hypothetical protein [Candidatus Limnocylindrales bacterium]
MASSDPSRARRFSLPDLADDRVEESIHAFLTGPQRSRGRSEGHAPRPHGDPLAGLTTRLDWMDALARESARSRRYRRPAAVMIVAAEPASSRRPVDGWLARVAGPIAHAVHRGLRETDLVARTSEATFQVLLPETTAREASRVAARVAADCDIWLRAIDAPVAIRTASAATGPDTTLEAALDRARASIEAASTPSA